MTEIDMLDTNNYNLKKMDVEKDNFIKIYDFPDKVCEDLVGWFHEIKDYRSLQVKRFGNVVDRTDKIKRSTDVSVCYQDSLDFFQVNNYLHFLNSALLDYINTFPILKEGPKIGLNSNFNIQWYKPNQGYFKPHCERAPSNSAENRVLVFMTYLNSVQSGGTIFPYSDVTFEANIGHTLIWPADWTHTHVGQIVDKDKYIATGWIEYLERCSDFNGQLEEEDFTFEETIYEPLQKM